MDSQRRRILLALAATSAGIPPGAVRAQPQPGGNYTPLRLAQPVESQGKIEILEFFWYGCPHCYNLQPFMERWEKAIPPDVVLRRVPAIFNARWQHDANLFYALEALGLIPKLHRALFDAIHRDRLRTDSGPALDAWLKGQGVDAGQFRSAFGAFGVQGKVRRAAQLTADYQIEGTPTLAVHGRYTVSADQPRGQQGMLDTVDFLVAKIRSEAAGKR